MNPDPAVPAARAVLLLLLLLLCPTPAQAQEPTPLRWRGHERLADHLTTAIVAGQIGAEFAHAWQQPDRRRAFGCLALENGVGLAVNETLKRIIPRLRPDGSDRKSFPSMHNMLTAANARGWRWSFTATMVVGRPAAHKHYLSDSLIGFGLGAGVGRICR